MTGKIKVPRDAKDFAAMWKFYSENIMSPAAGDVQRSETKRAFYVGAMLLRELLVNTPDGDAAEMAACDAIDAEFDAFMLEDIAAHVEAGTMQ